MTHLTESHSGFRSPSPWVERWAPLVQESGSILDLACGGGRHGRLFLGKGYNVTFLDKDVSALKDLLKMDGAEVIETDLETGEPFKLRGRKFDGVVVTCYLHRPIFQDILDLLAPKGVLIYETFAKGNEAYGHPAREAYLLDEGELLARLDNRFVVRAYEHGFDPDPKPGIRQRVCAVRKPL